MKEFLDSKDDPDKLQNFTNSWLAEPWEDTKLKTSADTVLERQTERPEFTAPSWTKFLTAGVDVQETSLYWTIRAWGSYITSQNIAHGQALSFQDIEQIMNTPYFTEDGDQLIVALCLIDSGYDADSTAGQRFQQPDAVTLQAIEDQQARKPGIRNEPSAG